jgi:hypothetical protein
MTLAAHTTTRANAALVTRLRGALTRRGRPMKVYELARVVGASPDRVHRTLCWHPADFVCVSGADHVECWTVRGRLQRLTRPCLRPSSMLRSERRVGRSEAGPR